MKSSNLFRVACIALALAAAACTSSPAKDKPDDKDKPLAPSNPFKPDSTRDLLDKEKKLDADGLYRQARIALDSSDYSTAISRYGQIAARFPFTEYATQADLERVYALYRSFQPDDALAAADKFLKEHPRHPAADYVQYIKGLVNTSRDEGLSGTLGLDNTKEDVSYLRRSFDDFSLLAQKYPNSRYAGDARQHMIDLRNRIAQHDLHVVHFYIKRGAFIAAAKRAEQILLQYPGAPATIEAMQILEQCYIKMGLKDHADEVHKLLAAQLAMPVPKSDYPTPPKKIGMFGSLINLLSFKPAPPTAVEETAPAVVPASAPAASDKSDTVVPIPLPQPTITVVPLEDKSTGDAVTPAASPAAPAPAEAPTFMNWLHGIFSTSKKPADSNGTSSTPAGTPASQTSKPATDTNSSAEPVPENKTPNLLELLYHSVIPEKKAADGSAPAAPATPDKSTAPATDSKDSTPAPASTP